MIKIKKKVIKKQEELWLIRKIKERQVNERKSCEEKDRNEGNKMRKTMKNIWKKERK